MIMLLERSEYMHQLQNFADNIIKERLEHLKVHPLWASFFGSLVQL